MPFRLRCSGDGVESTLSPFEMPGVDEMADFVLRVAAATQLWVCQQAFLSGREGRRPGVHEPQVKQRGVTTSPTCVLAVESRLWDAYSPPEQRLRKKTLVLLRQRGHTRGVRTALITGASRGLGRALARALAERGWRLVIDARGVTELEAVADELSARTDVVAIAGDVSDERVTHSARISGAAGSVGPVPETGTGRAAHTPPTTPSANSNVAMIGLAGSIAFFCAFEPMSDGITDEMNQGIGNLLNDAVVQFGLGSRQAQFNQLPCCLGGVPHRARDARIKVPNWDHARLSNFILQSMGQARELVDIGINAPYKSIKLGEDLRNVGRDFGQRSR